MNSSTKLNILHFSTQQAWGGGEQQLAYLYQGLAQNKIAQLIFCPQTSKLAAYSQQQNFTFLSFKTSSVSLLRQLKRLLILNKITLIHCHDAKSYLLTIICLILFRIKLPIVLSKKVVGKNQYSWLHALKYRYPQLRKIICVSHAVAQSYRQLWDNGKVVVIHDTVDINNFKNAGVFERQQLDIPRNAIVIGIIASLLPVKDHHTFLQCIAKLSTLQFPVYGLIIGDGPLKSQLLNYTHELNISDRIKFLGFRSDIPQLIKSLDILMITSVQEGLCSTLLQAMSAKVAIIASNVGGITEIIKHKNTGLLASAGNVDNFTHLAAQLSSDQDLRQYLVTNAYQEVEKYGLDVFIEKMLGIYNSI